MFAPKTETRGACPQFLCASVQTISTTQNCGSAPIISPNPFEQSQAEIVAATPGVRKSATASNWEDGDVSESPKIMQQKAYRAPAFKGNAGWDFLLSYFCTLKSKKIETKLQIWSPSAVSVDEWVRLVGGCDLVSLLYRSRKFELVVAEFPLVGSPSVP